MDDYIRRGAALSEACKGCSIDFPCEPCEPQDCEIKARLQAIPAADVVEVVRCRDCIFWDTSWNPGVGMNGEAYYCPRCHLVTLKDSFCSGAYRKDGGQHDG